MILEVVDIRIKALEVILSDKLIFLLERVRMHKERTVKEQREMSSPPQSAAVLLMDTAQPTLHNAHDAVAFAVHTALLTAGFACVGITDASATQTKPKRASNPPAGWNAQDDGVYTFVYTHTTAPRRRFLVKCLKDGDNMIVSASASTASPDDDDDALNVVLTLNVRALVVAAADDATCFGDDADFSAAAIYADVDAVCAMVAEEIGVPLLDGGGGATAVKADVAASSAAAVHPPAQPTSQPLPQPSRHDDGNADLDNPLIDPEFARRERARREREARRAPGDFDDDLGWNGGGMGGGFGPPGFGPAGGRHPDTGGGLFGPGGNLMGPGHPAFDGGGGGGGGGMGGIGGMGIGGGRGGGGGGGGARGGRVPGARYDPMGPFGSGGPGGRPRPDVQFPPGGRGYDPFC
jgi:hypothetical protein